METDLLKMLQDLQNSEEKQYLLDLFEESTQEVEQSVRKINAMLEVKLAMSNLKGIEDAIKELQEMLNKYRIKKKPKNIEEFDSNLKKMEIIDKIQDNLEELNEERLRYPTSYELNKLYNVIKLEEKVKINQKHFIVFQEIPDIEKKEVNSFKKYIDINNKTIEKEEQEKLEQKRKKSLELEKIRKQKKLEEKAKSEQQQLEATTNQPKEETIIKTPQVKEKTPEEIEVEVLKHARFIFDKISYTSEETEIINTLPEKNSNKYHKIIKQVLILITQKTEELYLNEPQEKKEIIKYEYLKDIVTKNYLNNEIAKTTEEKKTVNNIFFAKDNYGEARIYSDVENFTPQQKNDLITILELLKSNRKRTGKDKVRQFTNNSKISGIFEIKSNQLRVHCKHLGENNYLILLAKIKKEQSSNKNVEEIINRDNSCYKEYLLLQKLIKENKITEEMIIEEEMTFDKIKELIKPKEHILKR